MEAMDGPINFGQRRDWWGLLVEGYEFQPLYKNPYNPPYYKELFEGYGFRNYFNQHSFVWRANISEANARIFDRARRLYATPGYHVEHIDMRNLEDAAESFRIIYNKAWALFSGVRPMTQEEALHMMHEMKPLIDPEIIFFAYFNDEPIGFFITVPDLNRIIGRFDGKFGWWQKLQLLWELKVRKRSDRIFGVIFGIAPEFHGKGVESAIMEQYWHFMMERQTRYKTLELAWIGDFNPVMNRMIRMRYAPQGAYDLPLSVRPREGVPPLPAAGRQAPRVAAGGQRASFRGAVRRGYGRAIPLSCGCRHPGRLDSSGPIRETLKQP